MRIPGQVLYRLRVHHRFLYRERSLTICPTSKSTVPRSLSSAAGADALQRLSDEESLQQNVDVVRVRKEDNPNKVLEELFRSLPPLRSSNLLALKEELEALVPHTNNEALAEKLLQGVQCVADLVETETTAEELLDAMGSVILSRHRHSRYLQAMVAGLSRLSLAEERHGKAVRRAELELLALIEHSKSMRLPERISDKAKLESAILKGNDLNFLIKKQAARVKTKVTKKVVRYNLQELLRSGKVLECYSDLDTVQGALFHPLFVCLDMAFGAREARLFTLSRGKVYVTLWSVDTDIMVHAAWRPSLELLARLRWVFSRPTTLS